MRKIFLRWELDLYRNYLNRSMAPFYSAMIAANICTEDITIDEFRVDNGLPKHPDPLRGSKMVWEDCPSQSGDDTIPEEVLESTRNSIKFNEAGLSLEELITKYPKLFS